MIYRAGKNGFRSFFPALLSWAVFFSLPTLAAEKPSVISLDYCSDQYVLALADREQILALSRDATAAHSFYQDRAKGIRQFGATAEEVLHLNPELVVRYWGGFDMLPLLKKIKIPVVSAKYGNDIETLFANMQTTGNAMGQSQKTRQMIENLKTRHQEISQKPKYNLRAAYLTPSGITAGQGTFINDLIRLAGFRTIADELDIYGWQKLPVEDLVNTPPDIIIGTFYDLASNHQSSWSIARHGRIRNMLKMIPSIILPSRYMSCNGIFILDAAELIREKMDQLQNSKENRL